MKSRNVLINWIRTLSKNVKICFNLSAGNGQSTDIEAEVQEYLKQDIDCSRLQIQLPMIPDMIKTAFSNCPVPM